MQQLQRLSLALQERVKQFGSRLPKVPSSDSADDVSDVEHSIAAEILVGNRKGEGGIRYTVCVRFLSNYIDGLQGACPIT